MSAVTCVSRDTEGFLELIFPQCLLGYEAKRTNNTCIFVNLCSDLVGHDFCYNILTKVSYTPIQVKGNGN